MMGRRPRNQASLFYQFPARRSGAEESPAQTYRWFCHDSPCGYPRATEALLQSIDPELLIRMLIIKTAAFFDSIDPSRHFATVH
jgi:hypothetical protein